MNNNPKYRWPLNKEQIEVLHLLYRFRFGSADLIARSFGKNSGVFVYKRLKILQEQDFIGKRFDSSYRIKGKPAVYYLTPDGLRKLNERRASDNKEAVNAQGIYRAKLASESFVQSCLDVFGIYLDLKSQYGESLHFFTKSQLVKYDYFSEFVPGVYMRIVSNGIEKDYFLEYLQSGKPFFTVIQRLKQYIEYADSGEWEAETDSKFPTILLVCDKPSLQNRLLKKAAPTLDDADDEIKFYATIHVSSDIWFNLVEPDEPLSLSSI